MSVDRLDPQQAKPRE